MFISLAFLNADLAQARIVNRKVKEAPKVCSNMNEDKLLSKNDKKIFGTLKHSLIIENKVSVLNDLGKKICQWNLDTFNAYGKVDDFKYYIDEYKNYIYPYKQNSDEGTYTTLKISLVNCEIEGSQVDESLNLPKCSKPNSSKKSKAKKKLRTAST